MSSKGVLCTAQSGSIGLYDDNKTAITSQKIVITTDTALCFGEKKASARLTFYLLHISFKYLAQLTLDLTHITHRTCIGTGGHGGIGA